MLVIKILGCGSSAGVPVIGCNCSVCSSTSPYNKRNRSAILVSGIDTQILVDFGFDIRHQLLKAKVHKLDGAILTHDHADHVSGIDDLRIFYYLSNSPLKIYTDFNTGNKIKNRYHYLFDNNLLELSSIDFYSKVRIKNLELQFFKQNHGNIDSLGIRIADFVYSNDIINFPEESEQFLKNINTWVLDCVDYISTNIHSGLDKVLKFNQKYQPQKILLINMSHTIDYYAILEKLPANIKPLYDGFTIND